MFSEIYKGVRLDTHILGPFKDLDEKQASENFFAIKSQLKELAQADVRVNGRQRRLIGKRCEWNHVNNWEVNP
jgi:hypothetical protein